MEFETPRLFGTRWDGRVSLGSTRTGNFFEESFTYPFVGEVGRFGARQSFLWRETVFSYSTDGHPEYTHLLLPFLDQRWDVARWAALGRPGNLTILGAGNLPGIHRVPGFPRHIGIRGGQGLLQFSSCGFGGRWRRSRDRSIAAGRTG